MRPEYQHADYALFSGERPCVLLEAKKLDTPVSEGIEQSISYCLREGTRYFVVTNGRRWELYETHKPVPLAEKRILTFDLISDGSHEVALKALHLWRPNISASELTPAAEPIVGFLTPPSAAPQPPARPPAPPSPAPYSDAHTLATLQVKTNDRPPAKIQFPDGTEKSLGSWKELLVETVRWLVSVGKLGEANCPFQVQQAKTRYLLHTAKRHPSGEDFSAPEQVGPIWVETKDPAPQLARNARLLMEKAGEDPARVKLSS